MGISYNIEFRLKSLNFINHCVILPIEHIFDVRQRNVIFACYKCKKYM